MQPSLSEKTVASYLLCKTKAGLTLSGEKGNKCEYETLLEETSYRIRQRFLASFAGEAICSNALLTRDVLKSGPLIITNSTIRDESSTFDVDLLLRRPGNSSLGSFYYAPMLVHGGYSKPPNARQILGVTAAMLATLEPKSPKIGLIINAASSESPKSIPLSCKPQELRKILRGLEAVREQTPKVQINKHCDVCEFRARCASVAKAEDDLSQLRGLNPNSISKLNRRGIFTVSQYSFTYRASRSHSGRTGYSRQHALQAMAIRTQRLYVVGEPAVPECETEVYLDFEGDPERRFVYLIGVLISQRGASRFTSFWADTRADDVIILDEVYKLLESLGPCQIFTYGSFEASCLKRWSKDEKFKRLSDFIEPKLTNILSIIYRHIYFATYTNGLKDIAAALGFTWRSVFASGIQSIVWRRRWEQSNDFSLRENLTTYNEDDCLALQVVTTAIRAVCRGETQHLPWAQERAEQQPIQFERPQWETAKFHVAEFDFINGRAHFDYQRDRVFLRAGKQRRTLRTKKKEKLTRLSVRRTRSQTIELDRCPNCGKKRLKRVEDKRLLRVQYDLRIRPSGLSRIVTHYRSFRYYCSKCKVYLIPDRHTRLKYFGHSLHCWLAFHNIVHRIGFASTAAIVREATGIPTSTENVFTSKCELASVYEPLYQDSLARILKGELIHADETEIEIRGGSKAYVWVLTNMHDVVYIFRETREVAFLHELLAGFDGVLVTDFYGGYDSMPCKQQRCLIHLMRDLNRSIRQSPFDVELREFSQGFGILLKSIVSAIDEFGLKASKLRRFVEPVASFFARMEANIFESEVAEAYRQRFLKNRYRLFTFLEFDNVPWNNNNAEHAMKHVAWYRDETNKLHTADSIKKHLVLLGIYLTCRYRDVSFLKFLLSKKLSFEPNTPKADDDLFDLYPVGYLDPKRKGRKSNKNPKLSSETV